MADAIEYLQQLGFGEYEAKAYATLLRRSPLNGYELAKHSGIPRANIYAVLAKLEERGAVLRVESPDVVRYAPVSPGEMVRRLGSRFQATLEVAERSLSAIASPVEREHVWSTHGYGVLLEQAVALMDGAREHLLVAIWPPEARQLAEPLRRVAARGVNITTLCLAACDEECGGCQGHLYRYRVAPEDRARWLVLVPDGDEVLAGEIVGDDAALSVRTRQRLLVEVASWYIRHSIALAAVLTDLGPRLDDALSPQTHAVLATVGPVGRPTDWLAHMRHLLASVPDGAADQEPV